ncbi:methyl-accepting chemotaxis protein [Edaphobacter sp.]|uniref:methyl-accepting chemotaxis protein n=1 Tax=Edaphobacter sp. TaxID=1934404 RepID=UPI002DBC44B8|nr:methyl-accepting chemotaxis protein [Edaphobacter sp.]HEU5342262.1 methyl-accepting chemotaxis protein [Edaphobacter sp.]
MKLESKLGLSTGFLILAMLLSAFTAHIRIEEADNLSNVINNNRIPLLMGSNNVDSHLTNTISGLESYILFGLDPASSAAYRSARKQQFDQAEAALETLHQDSMHFDLGADGPRLASIESGMAALKPLEDKVEALNETKTSQGTAQAYDTLQNQILPLERNIHATISDMAQSQRVQTNQALVQLRSANRATLYTLWIATILGAIVGGLVSFLLARRITKAISMVAERADAIAAGDLTGQTLDINSRDQIGTLAAAMEKMQTSLSGIIGTVVSTAGSLTGSAQSMRSASDQMHRRIDQQSQQTQQAATAMQEMSASIAEVSRHTQSAAETARDAAETARDGGSIVKEVLGNMHSIATAVSDTSSTVGLLGEDSRKISQIVTVIDEIARKTNLLALNAAIEAARAGDQGRGFAVVAGEVRRLAESTAQATGEIASMIQGIQDRTRTAIASMESGTETVQKGVVTTNQAGEALEKIIGMAERVDRMIAQIAIAASQQAVAADQSSSSLDSIHSLSHENLTEMATTAAGVESLRSTAVALEQQVDRFKFQPTTESRVMRGPTTPDRRINPSLQPA